MILYRPHFDVIIFSFFFSFLFCILCSFVDNLLGFWVFLELCGLSIIPSIFFHFGYNTYGVYEALLCYIIVSGLSSVVVVSGLLISELYYFILLGFVIKFGFFPFILWMYRVFISSNWYFIFFLSVVMKFPVLFLCYLFKDINLWYIYIDSALTILTCSFLFWFFSNSWSYIWCHISLTSISTLFVASFCNDLFINLFIYFYYFLWASFCIIYFCNYENNDQMFWIFCGLLLVTPFSLPLFYKLSVSIAVFYSSIYILLTWSVYSFSEQLFLYKVASDRFYSNIFNNWLS